MNKPLTVYNEKRHFDGTPEPKGVAASSGKKKLQFVIQRHHASHLHYDFRLELDGVLKSWAIPKGPSLNPADKRLAMMVEDHPISYGKFEGEIPAGNYGAGTVEIWDKGTYEAENKAGSEEKTLRAELEKGSIKFILHGNKLNGSFALVRLKSAKENSWLLIKHKDEYAVNKAYSAEENTATKPVKKKPAKKTGKHEAGKAKGKTTVANTLTASASSVRSGKHQKLTHFITPMLAQLYDAPFDDDNWIFEIKWDGYRAIAEVKKTGTLLYSRNGLSFLALYPEIVESLKKIREEVILDGEVVVMDEKNRPSFQKLQQYAENRALPLLYYIFDCLSYKGKDITHLPLIERKKIARKVIPKDSILKYSDHVESKGKTFFSKVVEMDMEGIIAKRADSIYLPGKRNGDWLKIKNHNTQETIIAGYTTPRGSRNYFGALILGIYEGKKLKYIGHTGTGFTESILKEVYTQLQPLIRETSPFAAKVPLNAPVTWVEPRIVCEIKFSEITEEGILRQPVFMGLRIDKSAKETNHMDVTVNPKKKAAKKASVKKIKAVAAKEEEIQRAPVSEKDKSLKVDGHTVKLTNLTKTFWPEENITKGDVINYYATIAPIILPYLKDRPQSLKRNPNGIIDKGFYHKDAGDTAPSWVKSKSIYSESTEKEVDYIICNNTATLLYLNNLGCIEINPWNSTTKHLDKPDYLIMDVDPSDNNSFEEVIDTTLAIKEVLDKAGATGYCKTSGASGMHIYIPLGAAYTYEQIGPFAELIALFTQELLPAVTTMERSLSKRKGRIYLDYMQNKRGQTLASAYSLRPVPGASVSAPLLWKEVKHGLSPNDFTLSNIKSRIDKKGDIFRGVLTGKIDLKKCIKRLES